MENTKDNPLYVEIDEATAMKLIEKMKTSSILTVSTSYPAWIPVEERLPDIGTYIITGRQKYEFESEWSYFVDVADYVPDDGYLDNHWNTFNDWDEGQETHITAWMPLPKPYKK